MKRILDFLFGKEKETQPKGIPHNQIFNGNYISFGMMKIFGFSESEYLSFDHMSVGDRHILVRERAGYRVKKLSKKLKLHSRRLRK